MAVTLSKFQFSWKALNVALNTIVDAVNRNAPLEGSGIHLDEKGQQGVSINSVTAEGGGGQGGGTGGGYVPPTKIFFQGCQWQQVILVDPATCQQSLSYFLAYDPNTPDQKQEFDITLDPQGNWVLSPPA